MMYVLVLVHYLLGCKISSNISFVMYANSKTLLSRSSAYFMTCASLTHPFFFALVSKYPFILNLQQTVNITQIVLEDPKKSSYW